MTTSVSTRRPQRLWRNAFLILALLIILSGVLVWTCSLLHLLDASWASIAGALFVVLGTVLTLLQWRWPSSPGIPASDPPGVVLVKVRQEFCGCTVYADPGFHIMPPHAGLAATVVMHRNGNHREFIAEFSKLPAGNYTFSINAQAPIGHITVVSAHTALIDWSNIHP